VVLAASAAGLIAGAARRRGRCVTDPGSPATARDVALITQMA